MKKPLLMMTAALAVLAASATMSRAQGPFSDVPTDHWAYDAVEKLRQAGIVEGYPDKTYGGARPLTRYEFATAIARLQDKLATGSAPTKSEIDALRRQMNSLATKGDTANLRTSLDAFRAQLAQTRLILDDIDTRVNGIENSTPKK